MTTDAEHTKRIAAELHEAGASNYGASKFTSRYLPTIIHPDEHIMAVVYGRYKEDSGGLMAYTAGMLIATNLRVIFLDHKPGYTSMDEITYDAVSGVKKSYAGLFSTLTLHTRIADYVIRFANAKGIDKFVKYIESHRLEVSNKTSPVAAKVAMPRIVEPAALAFLKAHEVGVLSTVERTGNVHGAAIYYFVDKNDTVCFVTKSGTQKARDIFANQQAALTVYEASKAQTVQLRGFVEVVTDMDAQQAIFDRLIKPRDYEGEMRLPPVTTIHEEGYVALRITPTTARYTDYKQR